MVSRDDWLTNEGFQEVARHLDELVQEFEGLPYPAVREKVFDLLQTVDALHRESLSRLVAFIQDEGQAELLDRAVEDPVVRTLLVLYDLAPGDTGSRAPGRGAMPICTRGIKCCGGSAAAKPVSPGARS